MDYEGFNLRMFSAETELEKRFPKTFVGKVKSSYLHNTHNVKWKDVAAICGRLGVSYSEYQQMESLYLAKLQRI